MNAGKPKVGRITGRLAIDIDRPWYVDPRRYDQRRPLTDDAIAARLDGLTSPRPHPDAPAAALALTPRVDAPAPAEDTEPPTVSSANLARAATANDAGEARAHHLGAALRRNAARVQAEAARLHRGACPCHACRLRRGRP